MTDRELERRANRRLAVLRHVEEVSGNVAATCRYYGISPLAPARQRNRPRPHQTPHPPAQRQSGEIPPASTPKSSTDSSKARSSTTPTSSPRSCKSGRTTTTTTALTALLTAKHLTSAFVRKPKTRCHRPSSVAQGAGEGVLVRDIVHR